MTAEQIPVDIVTPQELAEKQAPPDELPAENKPAENKPEPAPRHSPISPCSTSLLRPRHPRRPHRLRLPRSRRSRLRSPRRARPSRRHRTVAPPPSQPAAPAYTPPEPDVSIKYQVLLGLPPDLSPLPPAPAQAGNKGDDNFDAPATEAADIASTLIAEFRRHLKTCSKLPASLSGADDVKVKLRVLMTPDGRLAAEPILIEASASMKGPLLMQGAIRALQACQPYAMLPADRYGEWKVLDLSFTPQDFSAS